MWWASRLPIAPSSSSWSLSAPARWKMIDWDSGEVTRSALLRKASRHSLDRPGGNQVHDRVPERANWGKVGFGVGAAVAHLDPGDGLAVPDLGQERGRRGEPHDRRRGQLARRLFGEVAVGGQHLG